MTDAYQDPIGLILSDGRYAITAKLGEGGMGAVYRAKDNNLQSDVVIKLPHRSMVTDAEFSRRFRDEVRSLVRLSHPHIVKVTDVGEWDGVPFAVLQFLPGGSLEDRLPAWKGPAALASLASWLGPVASALDYVHSRKMVHRDVKPGNILFDAQGHAFLGDFGVVKVLAAEADDRSSRTAMTGTGMVLGTPHYMATELIMGDPFDGRVDQYALAITAYELLCGRRPFEHEVPTRVLMMQAQEAPPSLASLCPWASPQLEAALFKGLAKNPNDRYPTCAAFSAAMVEAAGVGQAGRARIRCGSCGQTMTVSVEALAKLSRGGRSAPCPKCRGLLDLAAGSATVLAPSHSGESSRGEGGSGTAILDVRGGTADMPALKPRGDSPPPRGGTVVLGRVSRGTVAEPRPELVGHGEDEPERSGPPWVPIGIAAAALALAGGAALFWASGRSEDRGKPATPVVAEVKGPPAAKPARDPIARNDANPASIPTPLGQAGAASTGLETGPSVAPAPGARPEPTTPNFSAPAGSRIKSESGIPADPSNAGGGTGASVAMVREGPSPTGRDASTREGLGNGPHATAGTPGSGSGGAVPEPPAVADDEKPSSRNVPLAKLQSNPGAYAGQLITLEQVYCIETLPGRRPDGSLQVDIIESDLELTANSARVRFRDRFELGMDRRLADQLVLLRKIKGTTDSPPTKPEWLMKPANLTVKVADSPGPDLVTSARIVRLELFDGFRNDVRGSAKLKLVVLFMTETITPAGSTTGLGNNDEWQKIPKLGHAYNQFQKFFDGIQRQKSQMKWAAFNDQLNRVIVEGTRQSAANQAAAQRELQGRITPNLPAPYRRPIGAYRTYP